MTTDRAVDDAPESPSEDLPHAEHEPETYITTEVAGPVAADAAEPAEDLPVTRSQGWTSRISWSAVAVVVALAVLGAAWTLSSAIGSSPDDDFHLASIWCSTTAPDDACIDRGASELVGQKYVDIPAEIGPEAIFCFAGIAENSAACQPSVVETGTRSRSLANDGLYPGLYYELMGFTVGDQPVDSALLARAMSWLLCVGFLAAGWGVLPRRLRPDYLIVLLVTAVPHGVFLWASTNPSGLVVAAVAASWCALVSLLLADDRRARLIAAALLVVATVAAVGSRADAGIYLFIALFAAFVLVWREARARIPRRMIAGVGAIASIGLLISLAVLWKRLDSAGGLVSEEATSQPAGNLWNNLIEIPFFIAGDLGTAGLGWLGTPMPHIVWLPTIAVYFALVFWGIGRIDTGKALSLLCVTAGLTLVPYLLLWRDGDLVGERLQPRYVLPLVPILGITALYRRAGSGVSGLTAVQVATVLTLMTIAHGVALHRNIRRYVTGLDVRSLDLDGGREWWWDIPISPNVVWLAGSAAFGALAILLGRSLGALARAPHGLPQQSDAADDQPVER